MTSHEEPLYQECPTRSTSAQPDPRLVTSLECISNYTRSDKTHLYYRVGKLHNVLFVFKTSYLYFNCKQQQSILLAVLDFFLVTFILHDYSKSGFVNFCHIWQNTSILCLKRHLLSSCKMLCILWHLFQSFIFGMFCFETLLDK